MHAVAAEQETVVLRHRLAAVIQPHLGLDPQRAGQDVRPAGAALPHMVRCQAGQVVAA
jgi:hypothetical protein